MSPGQFCWMRTEVKDNWFVVVDRSAASYIVEWGWSCLSNRTKQAADVFCWFRGFAISSHTKMSSSQSEERTTNFMCEKNDTSNQNCERCFFMCEKNDASNQKPQRCESFPPNSSLFLQRRFAHIQVRESFSRRVFLVKKWKTFRKLEWNNFVCFTVHKENCREPAKQSRKGKNRTRRKLMLCFLSKLLCLPYVSLSLYSNRPYYLNSFIFNGAFRTNS